MKLKDKVVIVTGGGSGIGRAIALAFAAEGAKVVVADCRGEAAEDAVQEINKRGGEALAIKVDVSNSEEVDRLITEAVDRLGRLDIMVNNAGIFDYPHYAVADTPEEVWDRLINNNLKSVFLGCKYAIRQMLQQGGGKIINTASIAGLGGTAGGPSYTASKHGIVGLTRQIACVYANQNIQVNVICPGVIKTGMTRELFEIPEVMERIVTNTPMGRFAEPEEIAGAAVFLASEDSNFVTGATFVLDGGWQAR